MKKISNTYPDFYSCLKEIGSTTEHVIEELHTFVKDPLKIWFNLELNNLSVLLDFLQYKLEKKSNKYNGITELSGSLRDVINSTEKIDNIVVFSAEIKYPEMYKGYSSKGNGELKLEIVGFLSNVFTIKPELCLSSGEVNGSHNGGIMLVPGPSCILNPVGEEFKELYHEAKSLDNLFENIQIILEKFYSLNHKEIFTWNYYSHSEKFLGKTKVIID